MSQYLGLDFSTQKLKAVVLDTNLTIIHHSEVDFDKQLPEFRTQGGVIKRENGSVTAPVMLWVKALDLILDQLKLEGVNFSNIRAVSGAAQQHGSVYWQKGSKDILNELDSTQFLHVQLQNCFTIKESPTWMDSSTTNYCKILEEAIGGAKRLTEITGSRAYERFTLPQIAKIAETHYGVLANTERISLISNFACSLFLGDYADLDFSDASGMNLMDIRTKEWNQECLQVFKIPQLQEKLGKLVSPRTQLGLISKYFVKRFDFSPYCAVVSFSGDNPCSCAGMRLSQNDIIVSLGTSDTMILPLEIPANFLNGHLMCSAVNDNGYLGLLCFKNGSITRERIKNKYANESWEEFEKMLDSTPRGNFGNFGLYFDSQEILPLVKGGDFRWNSEGKAVNQFHTGEIEIRALIEGQFVARRAHAEDMGLIHSHTGRIMATGGASHNNAILQVLADVFNKPVYTQRYSNSAALGAAYLSKMAVDRSLNYEDLVRDLPEPEILCFPNKDAYQIYEPMLQKYRRYILQIASAIR